ncbi:MAG: sensor histidine kinase, partial [Eggerthella lenta]
MALFDRIRKDETKGFEQGEFSFRSKQTGKECWASYSVKRLTFEDKPQLLVVMRDVTADKEIQLSMKDAMDVAEAANAAKSEFLSRMSHEIRTPMNVILGTLQLARSNPDDREKVAETLKKIGDASDHLLGLINDVLDISKIENGKMTLASEPFRLSAVLSHVASAVRVQCEQRAQEFVVTTPPCADAVFVGDARRIKQLLLNLLTNAVKYTPCGGCVRFETTVAKGAAMGYRQVKFTVSDNGIGMSEEFKEHIFEPFSMEGRSREQGTGLGMPIVKNIVTMMAGDIAVESTKGQGTTFTVTFNLRIALEAERIVFEEGEGAEADDAQPHEL